MRLLRPTLTLAALAAACSPARTPSSSANLEGLYPSQVARGASLFGTDVVALPTGARATPDAAPGSRLLALDPHLAAAPWMRAGDAASIALSPDGATLLVVTAGFDTAYDDKGEVVKDASTEHVFVYDVRSGTPIEKQVVAIPNAFEGLAWAPKGDRFWVSGGPDDSAIEISPDAAGAFRVTATIALGHKTKDGYGGLGVEVCPFAAGIGVAKDGALLVVANHENDSVSLVDAASRTVVGEVALRPGGGVAGGEFPFGVAVTSASRAWVSAARDREVVEIDLDARRVLRRVKVGGMPVKLIARRDGARLFVADANDDTVSVVDTATARVTRTIAALPASVAPRVGKLRGSSPNALALSPDERTLYVSLGGNDAVAVVDLARGETTGLVPTGFYPMALASSADGASLFVAYGKSPTGPNPGGPWVDPALAAKKPYKRNGNAYSLQLIHGGLHAAPTPDAATLARLTRQVVANQGFDRDPAAVPEVFRQLRKRVKHVVFVVGENRTYDQLFADVPGSDGDPKLLHWGASITPNQHALATRWTTLDRFFDSGGVSGDGWQWTTGGRSTEIAERTIPIEYAERGKHGYDWEGTNRGINVGLDTLAERRASNPDTPDDPDQLPGHADSAAIDGPEEGGAGFLWDAALAKGLTVRNYGFFVDNSRYELKKDAPGLLPPTLRHPFEQGTRVAWAARASLQAPTDPWYRGYDQRFPDLYRVDEWARELDGFLAAGSMPALSLVRLSHDHFGKFGDAIDGVDTPDEQMADHDYAIGRLVEKLSRTPFWQDTIVVVVEDDAQNGADHVDAHRSFALFAGGHAKRGVLAHTPYTTPSLLRTIELLLGLDPLGQRDAFARPIAEAFSADVDAAPFEAIVPLVLRGTNLPLPPPRPGEQATAPRGTPAYWADATRGFDFAHVDAAPPAAMGRLLYCAHTAAGCSTDD